MFKYLVQAAHPAELFVNGMSTDFAVPGIIGGVSCETVPGPPFERIFYDGVRKFDGGAGSVAASDKWALGSCTKAMTCTLMGVLIQTGTPLPGTLAVPVSWETPLTDIFPEWAGDIEPRFQTTTLRHLACHRSGLRMRKSEDTETRVVGGANNDPRTFRRTMTYRLLAREHLELDEQGNEIGPVTTPGTDFHYGSGNYLVLGAVIEQLTNVSYEQAMLTRIFVPLGMSSAAFGMPASIPFYSQRYGVDFLGKSDPDIAGRAPDLSGAVGWKEIISIPGHNKYDLNISIVDRRPTYIQGTTWGTNNVSAWASRHYVSITHGGVPLLLLKNSPDVLWQKVEQQGGNPGAENSR